ncbi:MAG: potassium channel family protein [Patescibacteria group bacterium]
MESTVLILGSGHLANQAVKKLNKAGYKTYRVPVSKFREQEDTPVDETSLDYAREVLEENNIKRVLAVFIIDDNDRTNLHLLLAVLSFELEIPITISLLDERIAAHVRQIHHRVRVCNPAMIALKHFIMELRLPSRDLQQLPFAKRIVHQAKVGMRRDHAIWALLAGFFCLIFIGTIFFQITENTDFIDSVYLMTSVITSVNFNDVTLHDYNFCTKLARVVLLIITWGFCLLTVAFVIEYIVHRHSESFVYGRKKYNLKDHIILCGLGRFGYPLAIALLKEKEQLIVIENNEDNYYLNALRQRGVSVLVSDATRPEVLIDAGLERAAGLVSIVGDDQVNLAVGLLARSMRADLRVVLRIYDQSTAKQIGKRFGLRHTVSSSALAIAQAIDWLEAELAENPPASSE